MHLSTLKSSIKHACTWTQLWYTVVIRQIIMYTVDTMYILVIKQVVLAHHKNTWTSHGGTCQTLKDQINFLQLQNEDFIVGFWYIGHMLYVYYILLYNHLLCVRLPNCSSLTQISYVNVLASSLRALFIFSYILSVALNEFQCVVHPTHHYK